MREQPKEMAQTEKSRNTLGKGSLTGPLEANDISTIIGISESVAYRVCPSDSLNYLIQGFHNFDFRRQLHAILNFDMVSSKATGGFCIFLFFCLVFPVTKRYLKPRSFTMH